MSEIRYVSFDESILRGEGSEYLIRNYITREASDQVSCAVSELNGSTPMTINVRSDRIYYFLEGDATFQFENRTIQINKGAALYIPANTRYIMQGHFKAVLINSPAFNVADEKHF